MLKNFKKAWFFQAFFICAALSACNGVQNRISTFEGIALKNGYKFSALQTTQFPLLYAYKPPAEKNTLHVVIEGDGLAWLNRYTISDDPTPVSPVGLKLAMHIDGGVSYLARPCQYHWNDKCSREYWTSMRYADDVIATYMESIDQLKIFHHADNIVLSGFSGGAYIAMVLAAKRQDVRVVNTIAGLLDPDEWTDYQDISSIYAPMNFKSIVAATPNVQFFHACSVEDEIIPCELQEKILSNFQHSEITNHRLFKVGDVGHGDVWRESYSRLP